MSALLSLNTRTRYLKVISSPEDLGGGRPEFIRGPWIIADFNSDFADLEFEIGISFKLLLFHLIFFNFWFILLLINFFHYFYIFFVSFIFLNPVNLCHTKLDKSKLALNDPVNFSPTRLDKFKLV